ncbi:MAG TPA: crosslink repair DNA glycosylase YcaQ family protein [Bacteroidia bacterium]|jgi:uncharacterized protein YcaQ
MKISSSQARALFLSHQGIGKNIFGKGKRGVLRAIEHLSYVQIDTLAVVARAHHHTLWSRVNDHREKWIGELQEQKEIFEYWSHAAAYLPMRDFRFSLMRKEMYAKGRSHFFSQDKRTNRYVYDRIRAEGALQSKDFEESKAGKGMWMWKPAKRALEQLFMEGKLMVVKRQGFQKVYDLTERVLPADTDTRMPGKKEFIEHIVMNAVRSSGIASLKEMTYLRRDVEITEKDLEAMVKDGLLCEVMVEGVRERYFSSGKTLSSMEGLGDRKGKVHILSPFDNAVIQRKRLQNFFGFDFMIECYLPGHRRKFGYFCLPVLHGDRFVARFDPKADREAGTFYVKDFHAENDFKPTEDFAKEFSSALWEFARFNACKEIAWKGKDKRMASLVKKYL